MLFNSYQFLVFFPVVVLVYFIIPRKIRYVWLLIASYYFYMSWNAKYALLLLTSTAITYISGLLLAAIQPKGHRQVVGRKIVVAASFLSNLSILFFFKYFDFAIENINAVLAAFHVELLHPQFDILLPVGISFYTFQALSYTMDVYREEVAAEKNPLKYALFVSFFPQLVAGPIERSKNLLKQINEEHRFSYERMCDGLMLMVWGYFMKLVIADRIAIFVDNAYSTKVLYDGRYLLLASVLFAFQIYCDFAGYSTIAIGAAKVLGFDLMENFDCPYFSETVAEFWRRWHISLSSWFRDYLYIPLGGNRKGKFRKYLNTMIVFLVSGLWHGANWTYVIWGALHGVYQVLGYITINARKKMFEKFGWNWDSKWHGMLQTAVTFVLADFAWIFFRANNTAELGVLLNRLFTSWSVPMSEVFDTMGLTLTGAVISVLSVAIMVILDRLVRHNEQPQPDGTLRSTLAISNGKSLVYVWAIIIAWMVLLAGDGSSSFIYFQF